MERWKIDFLAGLRAGKPPELCARTSAGMPLSLVMQIREQDEEFAAEWDQILDGTDDATSEGIAPKRKLTAMALEAILWAQVNDVMAAAYFGMDEETFIGNINNNPKLLLIYNTARNAGLAAIMMRQHEEAMRGNSAMLGWLGKQHLAQSDKVESKIIIEEKTDPRELARGLMFLLAQGGQLPALEAELSNGPVLQITSDDGH